MPRRILGSLFILLLAGVSAEAWQSHNYNIYVATPEGDYLRAVGAVALDMAVSNRINAATSIMENEYSRYLLKSMMEDNIEYRKAMRARNAENYRKHLERVRDQPGIADVKNAGTLNLLLQDLMNPLISDAVSKYAPVTLDPGIIRSIPFQLGEKGERFSLNRLMLKGRSQRWVVAFERQEFAPLCRNYERAVQDALWLAMNGTMKPEAITAVQKAVDDLWFKLAHTPELLDRRNQRRYSEAKKQLDEIQRSARLFETTKMQAIFAEIDTAAFTTVHDLKVFMRNHGLTFSAAETPDEVEALSNLHTAIRLQLEMLKEAQSKTEN